jgi:tellurite resistance protein TehA-like permease
VAHNLRRSSDQIICKGFQIILVYQCVKALRHRGSSNISRPPRANLWIVFVLVNFLLGTLNYVTSLWFLTQAYVDHRFYAAGPSAWLVVEAGDLPSQINNSLCAVAIFLGDGVLVSNFSIDIMLEV